MMDDLLRHSGFLAGGFATNLLISAVAMGMGTMIGVALGYWRFGRGTGSRIVAGFGTNICRNVPSFVLLFYMASMIPSEIDLGRSILEVPLWIKAALALTFPVIGFASDQSLSYFLQSKARDTGALETFTVAWLQYFLIIIMASATASVIGADEIVGRANIVIAAQSAQGFLLEMYLFVSMWFLVTGLLFSGLVKLVLLKLRPLA